MIALIQHEGREFRVDLKQPVDISISMGNGAGPVAWYLDPATIEPVVNEHFTGSVKLGGSVNFRNIRFNPHGHITHTECVGHISREDYSVNQEVKEYFHMCTLVTVTPEIWSGPDEISQPGDKLITRSGLESLGAIRWNPAVVIRTTPNDRSKLSRNYSDSNPVYLHHDAVQWLSDAGVDHLLLDVPSVDRESDKGKLKGHHIFWNYPQSPLLKRSITELVYVPDHVPDGEYLLNLQFAPIENDASPSRPLLFKLI
jgi:kynurenine formamidase